MHMFGEKQQNIRLDLWFTLWFNWNI